MFLDLFKCVSFQNQVAYVCKHCLPVFCHSMFFTFGFNSYLTDCTFAIQLFTTEFGVAERLHWQLFRTEPMSVDVEPVSQPAVTNHICTSNHKQALDDNAFCSIILKTVNTQPLQLGLHLEVTTL